ncbi:urokinase plasminogen activator surface receptor-like [Scyliorhinus torazame]|uniref:urokinase plasminogen activator surface receptor-like n=1 Tax=Scyliorhinus torazame TaxID=75743 RepID=UPI003B59F936
MKLLLGAVLLIALVTGGYSLICHKCNSLTGSCALNTTTECNRTIHHTCRSISVNDVVGPTRTNFLLSGCGRCFGLATFNSGIFSSYVHTTCCSSDLCNDDVEPEIDNSTLNGLECHGCFAITEAGCSNFMTTIKCRGQQDRCVHTSGILRWRDTTTYVMKGCVSNVICQDPGYLGLFAIDPNNAFYCCKDNMCNLESRNFTRSTTPGPTTTSNSGPTQLNASIGTTLLLAFLKLVL